MVDVQKCSVGSFCEDFLSFSVCVDEIGGGVHEHVIVEEEFSKFHELFELFGVFDFDAEDFSAEAIELLIFLDESVDLSEISESGVESQVFRSVGGADSSSGGSDEEF